MSINKYCSILINGTKNMFKNFYKKEQLANIFSFLRLLIPIIIIITSLNKNYLLSLILFIIGAISDSIDGYLARTLKIESEYGKYLDQIADKLLSITASIVVFFINPYIVFVLIMEVLISIHDTYYVLIKKLKNRSSILGKFKQFPLSVAIGLGFISNINNLVNMIELILIIITFIIQFITLIDYHLQFKKELKA